MSHIIPRYKLMLIYDIQPGLEESYYDFVMHDMIPRARELGLHVAQVYHTLWGNYPMRQAEFLTEDLDTLRDALNTPEWADLENTLLGYINNYTRKIVKFRMGFQV